MRTHLHKEMLFQFHEQHPPNPRPFASNYCTPFRSHRTPPRTEKAGRRRKEALVGCPPAPLLQIGTWRRLQRHSGYAWRCKGIHRTIYKAIAVRLGKAGKAGAVIFDTEMMRMACAVPDKPVMFNTYRDGLGGAGHWVGSP